MKLLELGAEFLRFERQPGTPMDIAVDPSDPSKGTRLEFRDQDHYVAVDSLAEADGVMFLCPKCFKAKGGPVGVHRVICWFVGKVPDDATPKPGRWQPSGTGIGDLTFIGPAAASIQLTSGCLWHGFIRNGEATLA